MESSFQEEDLSTELDSFLSLVTSLVTMVLCSLAAATVCGTIVSAYSYLL